MIELSAESRGHLINISWMQRRNRLEKRLLVTVVLLAVTILWFFIEASVNTHKGPTNACNSLQCIIESANILSGIDEAVNPCSDFFKFACGKVAERTYYKDIPTESIQYQVQKQLTNILTEPINEDDHKLLNLQKKLFTGCMNEAGDGTSVTELKDILAKLGNWPVLIGEYWSEQKFNWINLIIGLKNIGLRHSIILQVHLQEDSLSNETNINVKTFMLLPSTDERKDIYKKLMIENAIVLGANEERAIKEMSDAFDFALNLTKLNSFNETRKRIQILELQKNHPEIDWLNCLKLNVQALHTFSEHYYAVFPHENFTTQFSNLIHSTSPRTLANFMFWTATAGILPLVSNQVLELNNQLYCLNDVRLRDRTDECRDAVSNIMNPIPLHLAYINKHASNSTQKEVEQMFEIILKELRTLIERNTWIDNNSKYMSSEWFDTIIPIISVNPEIIINLYAKEYKPINDGDSFLKSYLKIKREKNEQFLTKKRYENITIMDYLYFHGLDTQIYYFPDTNTILIPVSMLQGIYFEENRPMYLNYGILGKSIGSVLMYMYIYMALNKYSKYIWSEEVQKTFKQKTSCISHNSEYFGDNEDLYTSANEKHFKLAQIMGIRLAYDAYKSWTRENGEELTLVGLNYTHAQMFWISSLADVCFEDTYDTRYNNYYSDSEIVRQNFDFAIDFNCDLDSKMNPSTKCVSF